jgi:hypothetical protein
MLLSLLGYRRIWTRTSYYCIRILEAQKHTDPTAPDTQHCATRTTKIRIWILLFSSVAFKMPTKSFFANYGTGYLL